MGCTPLGSEARLKQAEFHLDISKNLVFGVALAAAGALLGMSPSSDGNNAAQFSSWLCTFLILLTGFASLAAYLYCSALRDIDAISKEPKEADSSVSKTPSQEPQA